jgi:hypothetical protein
MRHVLSSTKEITLLHAKLNAADDELVPVAANLDCKGHNYWRIHRLIENGDMDCFNLYGQRFVKRSDLEELEPPRRGRPPKTKGLTPEQLGDVI